MTGVNTSRETDNASFDDIFSVQRALVQPNLDRLSCGFARLDVDTPLVDAGLCRVFDEARDYASNPCVVRSP